MLLLINNFHCLVYKKVGQRLHSNESLQIAIKRIKEILNI